MIGRSVNSCKSGVEAERKKKPESVPCLICNNPLRFPKQTCDRRFPNRVKVLCELLSLPNTFLKEFVSSPVCSICCHLIGSIFQLHNSYKRMELKLKLKKDTIFKLLKNQYKLSNRESEGFAKSVFELKQRIQKALGIEQVDENCKEEEEADEGDLLEHVTEGNNEAGSVSEDRPVTRLARKVFVATRGKTIWADHERLKKAVKDIRIDHYYARNPDIKIPDGTAIRNCYVRLERLPSPSTYSRIDADRDTFVNFTHSPLLPESGNKNESEKVETEIVFEESELGNSKVRQVTNLDSNEKSSDKNPKIQTVAATSTASNKIQLVQCAYGSHSATSYCGMWFVNDLDRAKHFERFHSRKKRSARQKITSEVGSVIAGEQDLSGSDTDTETDEARLGEVFGIDVVNPEESSTELLTLESQDIIQNDLERIQATPAASTAQKSRLKKYSRPHSDPVSGPCPIQLTDEKDQETHFYRFNSKSVIKSSVRRPSQQKVTFVCSAEGCGKIFLRKVSLRHHGYSHSGEYPLSCKRCSAGFATRRQLREHNVIHQKANIKASNVNKPDFSRQLKYACTEKDCGQTFRLKLQLKHHSCSHTGKYPYRCKTCDKGFVNTRLLRKHKIIHPNINITTTYKLNEDFSGRLKYVCTEQGCGQMFCLMFQLKQHSYSHTGKYPYRCKKCSAGLVNRRLYSEHKRIHHNTNIKETDVNNPDFSDRLKYVCAEQSCGQKFRLKLQLKQHSYSHTGKYPYRCKICDKGIASYHKLQEHKATHRQATSADSLVFKQKLPRSVKCTFVNPENKPCKWTFRDELDMRAHVKHYHLGESLKNSYSCSYCQYSIGRKSCLEKHIRKKHMGESAAYICEICGVSYWKEQTLGKHRIRVHDIKGAFVCEDEACGKSFGTSQQLQRHRYVHLGQYPFTCGECDAGFSESYLLRRHIRMKHTVLRTAPTFFCDVCPKKFTSNYKLQRHKLCHSEERPFACHLCDWAFKLPDKLKRHICDVHTKSRPFLCQECGSDFKTNGHLTIHMKLHATRKKPFAPRKRRIKSPPRTLQQLPVVNSPQDLSFDIDIANTVEV